MSRALNRLIETHKFLSDHRGDGVGLRATDGALLDEQISTTLQSILAYEPSDVEGAINLTRFMLRTMCDRLADPEKAELLRSICDDHLDRLSAQLSSLKSRGPHQPADLHYLDSLTERVSFFDTSYRYVYTNTANCEFHRQSRDSMMNRPNWSVVGDAFFEKINKKRFDLSYAGHSMSYYSGHPCAEGRVFSVTFDPAYDAQGRVVGSLVTARDVSLLPIPQSLILRMPDA